MEINNLGMQLGRRVSYKELERAAISAARQTGWDVNVAHNQNGSEKEIGARINLKRGFFPFNHAIGISVYNLVNPDSISLHVDANEAHFHRYYSVFLRELEN